MAIPFWAWRTVSGYYYDWIGVFCIVENQFVERNSTHDFSTWCIWVPLAIQLQMISSEMSEFQFTTLRLSICWVTYEMDIKRCYWLPVIWGLSEMSKVRPEDYWNSVKSSNITAYLFSWLLDCKVIYSSYVHFTEF